ncbi:MAG: hypothetical protein WC455_17905 [Dehalococcoidia bacterium]
MSDACCPFLANALDDRQIYQDSTGCWNVRAKDPLASDILTGINYCPWCGEPLTGTNDD